MVGTPNFNSPVNLGINLPKGQHHPPLEKMDGYRLRKNENTPQLFFMHERNADGTAKTWIEGAEKWYLIQLWWVIGHSAVVQRNYLISKSQMHERGYVNGGYRGK